AEPNIRKPLSTLTLERSMTTPLQGSRAEADYQQSCRDTAAHTWHQFTYTRKTRRDALAAARDTWANIAAEEAFERVPAASGRAADVWRLLDTRHTRINL